MQDSRDTLARLGELSVMEGISLDQLAKRNPAHAEIALLAFASALPRFMDEESLVEAAQAAMRPDAALGWLHEDPAKLARSLCRIGWFENGQPRWPADYERFTGMQALEAVRQARAARAQRRAEHIERVREANRHDSPLEEPPRPGDEIPMREALRMAKRAAEAGEVPIGAVVRIGGRTVAAAGNAPVGRRDPTAHAEILALRRAAELAGNYRLAGAEVFVTLEPCPMCAGALVNARVSRVVWGADDPRAGAGGGALNVFAVPSFNAGTKVTRGVLAQECLQVLQEFFARRREDAK